MSRPNSIPANWLFVPATETSPVNEIGVTLKNHDLVSASFRFKLSDLLTALGNPMTVIQFKALSGYAMGVTVGYWNDISTGNWQEVSVDAYSVLSALNLIDPKTYPAPSSDASLNAPALKAAEYRPVYLIDYRDDQTKPLSESPVKWAYVDYGMKP